MVNELRHLDIAVYACVKTARPKPIQQSGGLQF